MRTSVWVSLSGDPPGEEHVEARRSAGYGALDAMERWMSRRTFFLADRYTIADMALYAYTHVAHKGDFDLTPYPGVRAWLDRVAGQPGHIPMTA